jgi:hypothetical protein
LGEGTTGAGVAWVGTTDVEAEILSFSFRAALRRAIDVLISSIDELYKRKNANDGNR